jgi:hypothetical protein
MGEDDTSGFHSTDISLVLTFYILEFVNILVLIITRIMGHI